eukprot:3989539-Pyramimonas_sp.AAC.1
MAVDDHQNDLHFKAAWWSATTRFASLSLSRSGATQESCSTEMADNYIYLWWAIRGKSSELSVWLQAGWA